MMKSYKEFLCEGVIEKLKAPPFSTKLMAAYNADRGAGKPSGLKEPEIVDTLLLADPSSEEQNTSRRNVFIKKLAEWYVDKQFSLEDVSRIRGYLSSFVKHKARIKNKNIDSYASLSDLISVIEPFQRQEAGEDVAATGKDVARLAKSGAEKVYEDENWVVIVPKTEEAACYYGSGTRWCTAAKEHNRFDEYNADGKLYILIAKQPDKLTSYYRDDWYKLQFHFESQSFMNAQNRPINLDEFFNGFSANEDLWDDFFAKVAMEYLHEEDEDINFVKNGGEDFVAKTTIYNDNIDYYKEYLTDDDVEKLVDVADNNIFMDWEYGVPDSVQGLVSSISEYVSDEVKNEFEKSVGIGLDELGELDDDEIDKNDKYADAVDNLRTIFRDFEMYGAENDFWHEVKRTVRQNGGADPKELRRENGSIEETTETPLLDFFIKFIGEEDDGDRKESFESISEPHYGWGSGGNFGFTKHLDAQNAMDELFRNFF